MSLAQKRKGAGNVYLRFCEVIEPSVDTGLEQMNLRQDHFVVQPPKLFQQGIYKGKCLFIALDISVAEIEIVSIYQCNGKVYTQSNQPRLQTLLEEDPFFLLSPFNIILKNLCLGLLRARNLTEAVDQCADLYSGCK